MHHFLFINDEINFLSDANSVICFYYLDGTELAEALKVPFVTPKTALQEILKLKCYRGSSLVRLVKNAIFNNCVTDQLLLEVLPIALLAPQVQARGYFIS